MAITKVKKIRSSNGISASTKYISNEEKTVASSPTTSAFETPETASEGKDNDIEKAIKYTTNEEKTVDEEVKLVSGHNCNPLTAAMEMESLIKHWKKIKRMEDNTMNAYHIIQSFDPKDNDHLTYEMAHEIGLKFCDAIEHIDDREEVNRRYKILVSTHTDREHIHNHLIMCPYDIDTGRKYHSCNETYRQLRKANDDLCKEYGLSIILNPDEDRKRSFIEEAAINENKSWKESIRKDIDSIKSVSSDWDTFVSYMKASGYKIKEGKHVTYTKSFEDEDGNIVERKIRDSTLGKVWTKESIENYWKELSQSKTDYVMDKQFFYEPKKFRKKSKYKIPLYDDSGRKRNKVELILLLAKKIIENEGNTYNPRPSKISPIYYRKDYKLQAMIDSISVARTENIKSINDIEDRLNEVGKDLSHNKQMLNKNVKLKEKMDKINEALSAYKEVKDVVENIGALKEGPLKKKLQEEHAAEIEKYKNNKVILYRYKCVDEEQIADFEKRYEKVKDNIINYNDAIEQGKAEYKKYKKLQNNVELAQNREYVYGPEFKDLEKEEPSRTVNKDNPEYKDSIR